MPYDRRTFLTRGCAGAAVVLTAGCTRGDASEASLSVQDQTGEGGSLTVEEAVADEPFYVAVEYDGGTVETDTFEAGARQQDVEVTLDPPLEETTTVDVAIYPAEEDGGDGGSDGGNASESGDGGPESLASESIEYEVETPPEATLTVEDQRGGGQWLTVQEASADVDYYVDVDYANGQVSSETFDAGTTQQDVRLLLAGVPGSETDIDVALRAAEDDRVLASDTIQYTEAATLHVESNSGEGGTMTVHRASAEVPYYVEVEYSTVSIASDTFEAGTVQTNLEIGLQPPIDTTRQVRVVVRDAESDEALTEQSVQYKYRGAVLEVDDQSGDGQSLLVSFVEADTDYYVRVQYGTATSTSETFPGGSVQRGTRVPLDPPLESSRELTVAVHAADNNESLYDKTIQYSVD